MNMRMKKIMVAIILCGLYASVMARSEFIIKYKLDESQKSFLLNKSGGDENIYEDLIVNKLMEKLSDEQLTALSVTAQTQVKDLQSLGTGAHLIKLSEDLDRERAIKFIKDVEQLPDVEYIVENRKGQIMEVP